MIREDSTVYLVSVPPAEVGNCTDGEIRLVNGQVENEGRVEICFDNVWGTICDDEWDGREATVVCRQLGYSDQVQHVALHEAFFGSGSNPIHLDELDCVGNEERLIDCDRSSVGDHNCFREEDASVICTGEPRAMQKPQYSKPTTVEPQYREQHCSGTSV